DQNSANSLAQAVHFYFTHYRQAYSKHSYLFASYVAARFKKDGTGITEKELDAFFTFFPPYSPPSSLARFLVSQEASHSENPAEPEYREYFAQCSLEQLQTLHLLTSNKTLFESFYSLCGKEDTATYNARLDCLFSLFELAQNCGLY